MFPNSNDPQDFFVQLKATEEILLTIMNDLEDFYSNEELTRKYKLKEIEAGIVGLPCAALYLDKGSFFSKPLGDLNYLNHHWPKVLVKI